MLKNTDHKNTQRVPRLTDERYDTLNSLAVKDASGSIPTQRSISPIQMACNWCEGDQLQMQPLEGLFTLPRLAPPVKPVIQKQSNESDSEDSSQSASQTEYCNRPVSSSEVEERNQILSDFCRGLSEISESFRRVIVSSMCDFSLDQLNMMKNAGLRFWIGSGVPPIFAGNVQRDTATGSASYARAIRTIFLGNRVNPGYLTHEMAHAWDHIRNMPNQRRVRLDDINDTDQRMDLMRNPGQFLSETNRRQDIQIGDNVRQMTFSQMHAAYNRRVPRRELAFSGSSRLGYSQTSPKEFYAEGYTVFHGNSIRQQAKLYKYARELYAYLHAEAIDQQLPVPDIAEVRSEAERLP